MTDLSVILMSEVILGYKTSISPAERARLRREREEDRETEEDNSRSAMYQFEREMDRGFK